MPDYQSSAVRAACAFQLYDCWSQVCVVGRAGDGCRISAAVARLHGCSLRRSIGAPAAATAAAPAGADDQHQPHHHRAAVAPGRRQLHTGLTARQIT